MHPLDLTRRVTSACVLWGVVILASALTFGQDPPALQGNWVATAGDGRTFRGRWTAQVPSGQPDVVQGGWTLSDGLGKALARGIWTARRRGQGWTGTWSAQDEKGRQVSGTWRAEGEETKRPTLQTLLERTLTAEISGTWQSGRLRGNWWLKGLAPLSQRP